MDVRNTNLDKAVTVANISIAVASYNGIAFLRNPFPVNLIQTRKTKQTQEGAW
jgi:adenosine/AMP kinase